jgi:hypothetical protein
MRKRFVGASVALHLTLFVGLVGLASLRVRGGPRPAPAQTLPPLVKLVDLPRSAAKPPPAPHADSPIAYPQALRATPRPATSPTPRPTPRPTPTPAPREIAEYRKLNPALQKVPDDIARMQVARLKQLGLSAASASSITKGVDKALIDGAERFYNPTTPGSDSTVVMRMGSRPEAPGTSTFSAYVPPFTWVSTPSPLEAFLGRILPPGKPYEADLTTDPATGLPELRLAVRKEDNVWTNEALTFIERWNPSAMATPVVDVQVLKATGTPERQFKMPLPPFGGTLDEFKDQMYGLTMLAYQEALAGRSLATP